MATTAEFIGVYIADIITTATITIIVATIITITAIGSTCRVLARAIQLSPGGKAAACAAPLPLLRHPQKSHGPLPSGEVGT